MTIKYAFGDKIDEETKSAVKEAINECNESFTIASEDAVRLSVIEAYIDHLYNTKVPYSKAKDKIEDATNRVIELYNCGSKAFLTEISDYLRNKWSKHNVKADITRKVATKLSNINPKFVTSKVKAALETYAPVEENLEGYAIAESCIEKVSLDMVNKCFPDDFKKLFR